MKGCFSMYSLKDADALYLEYIGGKNDALSALLELFGDRLTEYVRGYVKNPHDAEDLMIDAFAYLAAKKPHIHTSFSGYMYKSCRSRAISFLRKHAHTVFISDSFSPEAAYYDDPEKGEIKRVLGACMGALSAPQREALCLVYAENLSYAEAGKVMHRTAKQIDKLLQTAKKNIRPMLEKEGISGAFR